VLLYAYAIGVRSSRQVERRCTEDLAFRVLAGNQTPDHVTIARFRSRHQQALAGFLVESLRLCAAAGLVRLGLVALDGTKVAANAADKANRTLDKLEAEVAEILQQAAETDQAEDRQHGLTRGDELPASWPAPAGGWPACSRPRRGWKRMRPSGNGGTSSGSRTWPQRPGPAAESPGRTSSPAAVMRRPTRGPSPTPPTPTAAWCRPAAVPCRATTPSPVVTEHQVVVAAALTQQANDLQQLAPMLQAVDQTLAAADVDQRPGRLLADAGYWSIANLTAIPGAPDLYIPPARHGRQGKPRKDGKPSESKSDGLRAAMAAKLASDQGKACYALRKATVEPVFGQLKEQQDARRFLRRGLAACDAECKLLCGTHNLLKLWRHTRSRPAPTPTAA
jgi:hypothetical protein